MTDWDLVRWLLDFNVLVTHKFTLFYLKDKISLNLVLNALLTWALNLWGELLSVNALIDLKSTSITSVDCDLHARFDITASGNNTFYGDKSSNRMGLNLSHLDESFLSQGTSWDNLEMVASLKFWWNTHLRET